MVARSLQSLILGSLDDIEADHLVFDFFLKFLKINNQLVSILVECRSVFAKNKPMNLQFLVNNSFDFLHGFQD